jgi:hypothetical protein
MSTAAMMMFAVSVFAQAPNFAGKWAPDADKNPAAMAGGGGGGRGGNRGGGMNAGFEVKQDATTLTQVRDGQNGPQETKYTLDGASHDVPMGQATAKVTAKVDGSTIVIDTTRDMGGNSVTSHAVWSMDGADLKITTTSPGRNGGEPTTRTTYYKKG